MVLLALFSLMICVVGLNILIPKFFSRTPVSRVLYLREITSPPEAMVTLAGKEHKNPFVNEFVVVFEFISNILDYAVMKYVADDVRILSRQEGKHAVLHHAAMKQRREEGESATRWKWFLWIADFLMLRCSPALGVPLVYHIEAAAWAWFFLPMYLPFVNKGLPNLFVFHGMEEAEHGSLTVQSLRKKTNSIFALLTFPLVVIVHIILLLCPPISALIMRPGLLLSPSTYVDLLSYYISFGVSFLGTLIGQIFYGVLPFPENEGLYTFINQEFQNEIKARGVTFNIVDKETYKLY